MSHYVPPNPDQQPPEMGRLRAASHTDRYIPDEYRSRPPIQQQPSAPMAIPRQPNGPSFAGQPINGPPPVPNPSYYGSSAPNAAVYGSSPSYFGNTPGIQSYQGTPGAPPYPQDQPSGPFPGLLHPQPQKLAPPIVDGAGHMRAPPHERRPSAGSTRSHHSHHSRHSKHSHDGRRDSHHHPHHHRRNSEDSFDDYHRSDARRSRDSHRERDRRRSADDSDLKPIKRTKTHRPSWGDTIYSAFSVIKDALGPRDKY